MARFLLILSLAFIWGLFFVPLEARAEVLSIDLGSDHVDITTAFNGSDVVVFGSRSSSGDVAIVLEGPKYDVVVRKKSSVLGAWVNRSWVRFKDVPLYYDYALSGDDPHRFVNQGVGLNAIKFENDKDGDGEAVDDARRKVYRDAFVRGRQAGEFYPETPEVVQFMGDDFFKAVMHVPADVPKGVYAVRGYLIRDGEIVGEDVKELVIGQVGFSASVFQFAHSRALIYSLLVVFIAVFSGWLLNKIARRS